MSDAAQFTELSLGRERLAAERRYESCAAAAFGLSRVVFNEMLAEIVRRSFPEGCREDEREKLLNELRLEDLVLARACARGVEPAWERFVSLYRGKLYLLAMNIAGEESAAREMADSLYANLFGTHTGQDGRRVSKFDSFTGRGSLEGWLKAVLAQEYVNRYRRRQRLVPFDEAIEVAAQSTTQSTTTTLSTTEHARLSAATDAALGTLSVEERFLLAAHFLDDRTLAEIGRMLSVHESTVSRRLEKITSGLRKRIVKELCRRGTPKREAEEMLAMDVRDLAIDVRERLAQGGPRDAF